MDNHWQMTEKWSPSFRSDKNVLLNLSANVFLCIMNYLKLSNKWFKSNYHKAGALFMKIQFFFYFLTSYPWKIVGNWKLNTDSTNCKNIAHHTSNVKRVLWHFPINVRTVSYKLALGIFQWYFCLSFKFHWMFLMLNLSFLHMQKSFQDMMMLYKKTNVKKLFNNKLTSQLLFAV